MQFTPWENPMGTDGFEFVEYAAPDPAALGRLFETMGFGQALDAKPLLLIPGVLSFAWGGVVKVLAAGHLGALGRRLHLPRPDRAHEVAVLAHRWKNSLDRDDLLEAFNAVALGLEDLGHAALAEPLE